VRALRLTNIPHLRLSPAETGSELDAFLSARRPAMGLDYYQACYYDPAGAQFASADTKGAAGQPALAIRAQGGGQGRRRGPATAITSRD
jgi:hypothetical protein